MTALAPLVPPLGHLALLLSLVIAVYTTAAAALGGWRRRPALVASARNGMVAVAVLSTLAAAALLYVLGTHDFSVKYVADQTSRDMPWHITLAAFYGSQAGSLLFWEWTLALWAALAVLRHQRRHPRLFPWIVATLAGVEAFFAAVLVALSDPFERLWPVPSDGRGLNPLLYDSGMLLHPPFQLMGYMASSVPFAFVVAALVTGRLDAEWIAAVRRWTLAAWALLGTGLLFGAWWAYHVLGWGGYWGWDPVENVALLPWLTMTAYLHSAMVQERRGMLKTWNVSLVLGSFALSIFGTLVVRSGMLSSVHAFGQSPLGPVFFAFLTLVIVLSAGLLLFRLRRLGDESALDAVVSRESSFLLNNLLLVSITLATFWGTIYPLVSETFRGVKVAVGPPFYQQVNGPLLGALMALMAVCALLPWRRASPRALLRALRWPALAALLVAIGTFLLGAHSVTAQIGTATCVLAAGAIAVEYARGVRVRRRSSHEPVPVALTRLVARGRRRYGGYLVHLAVVCIGLAVVGSLWFQSMAEATVLPGGQFSAGRYTFTYRDAQTIQTPGVQTVMARVDVTGAGIPGGAPLRLEAGKRFHRNWEEQPSSVVGIRTVWPWLEDVYLVMAGWDDQGRVTFQAFINPMMPLLWAGTGLFWVATLIVLWPERRRGMVRAAQPSIWVRVPAPARPALLGAGIGAAIVVSLFVAMRAPGLAAPPSSVSAGIHTVSTTDAAGAADDSADAYLASQSQRIAQLEAAVQADPNAAGALFDLGETYMEGHQWDQAIAWFGRLLHLDSAHLPASIDLAHAETDVGIAYMNLGQYDRAAPLLEDVLAQQPDSAQVHYILGFLYATAPTPDAARAEQHWQEVLRLAPDSEWAEAARPHISTLQSQAAGRSQP